MVKKITVVIMCYGLFGYEYRTPEEVKGLIDYFYDCAQYIATLHKQNKLSGVVLCGGFTNPQYPNVSEASTSMQYLEQVLSIIHAVPVKKISVCLEEQSRNTAQNIMFVLQRIQGRFGTSAKNIIEMSKKNEDETRHMIAEETKWENLTHNVIFVCDYYRKAKVSVMLGIVDKYFRGYFQLDVRPFKRNDIHSNSSWHKQWREAIIYWMKPSKFYDDLKVRQK